MTQKRWRTALSNFKAEPETIAGYRLTDIMQNLDFGGSLFVLYQQRIPSPKESRLLNAVLVSVLDHSIVAPSVMSRVVAASGVPLQACVAAGILTIGDVHGGAGQEVARKLGEWVKEAKAAGISMDEKARAIVAEARKTKTLIEGFGHPLHPVSDLRVDTLGAMARELGLVGPHLELMLGIEAAIEQASRKRIPLNIDGVISGILCDLGFDWRLARAFVFVPRAAGIAAHAVEEVVRERGWRVVATADEIEYDGPELRPFPARR